MSGHKLPQPQRLAAVALLAVGLIALAAAIAMPAYFAHEHFDGEIARMKRQILSLNAISHQRPQLIQSVEVLKARDAKKFFLKGASPALASAELQEAAKSAVESNGGRLLSMQAVSASDDATYRRIGATVQCTGNIQSLRRMLHAIEANEPYLFIDALTLRSQVASSFKPTPGVEPDVFIQFDVFGYALPTPRAESTAAPSSTQRAGEKA